MKYLKASVVIVFLVSCYLLMDGCRYTASGNKVRLDVQEKAPLKISEYSFFKEATDFTKPNSGVVPYGYINSMFNDHSLRHNFVYIPDGKCAAVDSNGLLNLPVGSALINIIYYWKDERKSAPEKQLIETQLLVRTSSGWEARDYVWNDEQSDAELTIAGDIKPVTWISKDGQERQVNFVVPSKNECKSCHWNADHITPIGIKAANLNRDFDYATGKKNQLQYLASTGLLKNADTLNAAAYPSWRDTSIALERRVRSYLDANCAHCHNPNGPAYVSGLFLNWDNYNMAVYGVCKSPPSAGKGSCNLKYDIVPGKPGESIIVCRMAATELGVKMPQLGRTIIDNDGVALIIQWISQLKGDCSVQ